MCSTLTQRQPDSVTLVLVSGVTMVTMVPAVPDGETRRSGRVAECGRDAVVSQAETRQWATDSEHGNMVVATSDHNYVITDILIPSVSL